jgi:hypothetical protein
MLRSLKTVVDIRTFEREINSFQMAEQQTRLRPSSFFDYKKGELQQKSKEDLEKLKAALEAETPKSEAAKKKKETTLRYIDDTLNDLHFTSDFKNFLDTVPEPVSKSGPKSVPVSTNEKGGKAPGGRSAESQQDKAQQGNGKQKSKPSDNEFMQDISKKMALVTIGLAQIGEDVTQGKKGLDLSGWAEELSEQKEGLEQDWSDVIDENRWILNWFTPKTRLATRVGGTAVQSWSKNNGKDVSRYVGEYTEQFSQGVSSVQKGVADKVAEIRSRFGPLPDSDGEEKDPTSSLMDFQEDGDQGQE